MKQNSKPTSDNKPDQANPNPEGQSGTGNSAVSENPESESSDATMDKITNLLLDHRKQKGDRRLFLPPSI